YKGRKCCSKIDSHFVMMATDLYNLVPAIGEVNFARSNYRFAEFQHLEGKKIFRGCNLYINKYYHAIEPNDALKGWIARTYLYMEQKYALHLSKHQKEMFN